MWQALRTELFPLGVEIVTVGIDAAGADECRPFIEAAQPEHPSLVDTTHRLAELFGVVNIPNGVWIDEHGTIVRPAEPANPHPPSAERPYRPAEGMPDHMNEIMDEASRIKVDGRYADMVRDWARNGADSPYVLDPDEVVRRSRPRDRTAAEGQAQLELGAALWARGDQRGPRRTGARPTGSIPPTSRRSGRRGRSPRQTPAPFARFWQGPVPGHEDEWPYESDWLGEVRTFGAEQYYPPLEA